jgi:hypothetical protein
MEHVRGSIGVLLVLGLVFMVLECTRPANASMEYSIKPCNMSEGATTSFSMNASNGMVKIHQTQSYVCCANVTLRMETNGKTIRVYEDNIGEMCRCICPFEAEIEISDAGGYERIEVYGVKFKDVQGYELLFNSTIPG